MNIFYTHEDPKQCATEHNNKHCIKMILEYAQILSTTHRYLNGTECMVESSTGRRKRVWSLSNQANDLDDLLYACTHVNHPSTVWARQAEENYVWLANLLHNLCEEYTYRYDKVHKTQRVGIVDALLNHIPSGIGENEWSEPTLAMPDKFHTSDHRVSYQNYILTEKSHLLEWKRREPPSWYTLN